MPKFSPTLQPASASIKLANKASTREQLKENLIHYYIDPLISTMATIGLRHAPINKTDAIKIFRQSQLDCNAIILMDFDDWYKLIKEIVIKRNYKKPFKGDPVYTLKTHNNQIYILWGTCESIANITRLPTINDSDLTD